MTQSNTQTKGSKTVEKPAQIKKLVRLLGATHLCGLTATALYLKGGMNGARLVMMNRAKWKLFTDIRYITQISELVENGYWSKLLYKVNETNTDSLKHNTSGSDYTVQSLKEYYESNNLEGQIIEEVSILKKEGRKSIIIFVTSIEEADDLHKKIPNSAIVHSKIASKRNEYFINSFKELKIQVVINVNCLSVGFDHPQLDAIITARPTSSIAVFYQQLGRGVRIHKDKENCKIVDFSGNVSKFGRVEELEYAILPYYGSGLFNSRSGELLTDYPLAAMNRPTKESLIENGRKKKEQTERVEIVEKQNEKNNRNPEITFGMFKGRRVWDIARSEDSKRFFGWANWYIKESQKPSPYPMKHALIGALREYLQKEANDFGGPVQVPRVKKIEVNIADNLF